MTPASGQVPSPYLWLVGFPEPRGPIRSEDLARHTTDHSWLTVLAGGILHKVPGHGRAQLAAGDVSFCPCAVHRKFPVAQLPLQGKGSAGKRRDGQPGHPSSHLPPPFVTRRFSSQNLVSNLLDAPPLRASFFFLTVRGS